MQENHDGMTKRKLKIEPSSWSHSFGTRYSRQLTPSSSFISWFKLHFFLHALAQCSWRDAGESRWDDEDEAEEQEEVFEPEPEAEPEQKAPSRRRGKRASVTDIGAQMAAGADDDFLDGF
jgi:hypothetical protein